MNKHNSAENEIHNPSRQDLRQRRIDSLLDSCCDQVLQQIIGPFGLTPAMFNDMNGGSVTTTHNFEKGVVAKESDAQKHREYRRNLDSPIERQDFDKDFPEKRRKIFKSQKVISSAWTGKNLFKDGRTHLDHVTSVERIERNSRANLNMSKKERVNMANAPDNLVLSESDINQSMGAKDKEDWANGPSRKDPTKSNAEHFGVDLERIKHLNNTSTHHVKTQILRAQVIKQGTEVFNSGMDSAVRNAFRQGIGMLLHELVSGSFSEISRLAKEQDLKENFVDHLIQSIKNVAARISGKFTKIFEAIISGGVQGFISNFLTYIINCFWTTAAKVVTIIREGMQGLWKAIKLMFNQPEGMSGVEVAREVTKIIAGVVTTSLGFVFEKSVESFILSIPMLAPFSDIIAPALTAILTGVVTALVIYGIDRMFDWLNDNSTEVLDAQMASLEASSAIFNQMAFMLDTQFQSSIQYHLCIQQYTEIESKLAVSCTSLDNAITNAEVSISTLSEITATCEEQLPELSKMDHELHELLDNYLLVDKDAPNV